MAQEYFSDLNYTLANEDTAIEYDLLPEKVDRVFCISGSGSRVLPLLARHPREIEVIDMAQAQLYLMELRFESAKIMSYQEWLFFMGYRGSLQFGGNTEGDDRFSLFEKVPLSTAAKEYWLQRRDGWAPHGFIFLGRWENHFIKLGKIFRDYLRCDFLPIFDAHSLKEQIQLWEKHWPTLRLSSFLKIAASEWVFNKFLYKGHFAGADDKRTERRSPSQFIEEEFHRLFHTQLARKSYFLQMLFLGRVRFEEGLPFEAQQPIFEAIKKSPTQVTYRQGNLLTVLPEKPWDFISLSDTVSYLSASDANSLLQKLHSATAPRSLMVIRSFLRAPTAMNQTGWEECKDLEEKAWKQDVTGVYQFHIFRKKA